MGDRFLVLPDSEVTDNRRFHTRTVKTTHIGWWLTDTVRYEVRGSILTVWYTSYPADAPVPSTKKYRRSAP